MDCIKNEDLILEKIPSSTEEGASRFSATFNGYKFWGSFKGCADVSFKVIESIEKNNTKDLTLSELRTCLFLNFRALRHVGGEPIKSRVDKLLELIRDRVSKKDFR